MPKFPFLAALAAALLALPAAATQVLPVSLPTMIDQSETAFHGTVLANRVEREAGGRIATYTTFAVREALKGTPATTHVIKQVGGDPGDGGPWLRIHGVPTFAAGHDYVVFMPATGKSGFASPVGLAQGRFRVMQTPEGPVVSNGSDLRLMAWGMSLPEGGGAGLQALRQAGPPLTRMGLDDFRLLVRARAGGAR